MPYFITTVLCSMKHDSTWARVTSVLYTNDVLVLYWSRFPTSNSFLSWRINHLLLRYWIEYDGNKRINNISPILWLSFYTTILSTQNLSPPYFTTVLRLQPILFTFSFYWIGKEGKVKVANFLMNYWNYIYTHNSRFIMAVHC